MHGGRSDLLKRTDVHGGLHPAAQAHSQQLGRGCGQGMFLVKSVEMRLLSLRSLLLCGSISLSFTGLTPGDIQELPQATKRMIGSELRKVKGFAPWGLGVGPPLPPEGFAAI